ncbi:MAG: hypothetical protein ING66_09920 [Rhodocyclaceae bacterium]|jgi:hypothetical protein|nr:hypothetical protein [Rhodocyclaceae bacterium]MCE2721833.1 hypothetical protein [Betaproteobacteria bacterium]MCA3019846.1 hypothetical protein [Rhodocyclaceae bacterium]MCA3020856.1 hypothetical protein [Rhodocyclaceae bacterium]MCA3024469.1 hypothetical protein [Rhodocyclaceae bacterium]
MLEHLNRLEELRGPTKREADFLADVKRVKQWQHRRLRYTYHDLSIDHRFAPATAFFFDELYGEKDTVQRDRDLLRMYPTIKRLLPKFAFETLDNALALDVLSEEFDQALAAQTRGVAINNAVYCEAFRAVGRKADRLRQVALMQEVGHGLDLVVKKPLIYSTLKMLRRPSKLAGLAEMQQFLEAGFSAFRHMKGATPFLHAIAERETALIEAIFLRGIPTLPPEK